MSDYIKATNFTSKDSLATGDVGKVVKGSELDAEFTAIAAAIASKGDINSETFTGTPTLPAGTIATTVSDNTDSSTKIATTAFVQSVKTLILQDVFPVGSIYTSYTTSTNPGDASMLNFGTWVAIEGKVLAGYDAADSDFSTAGDGGTGGAKTDSVSVSGTSGSTALTEAQMPKHYHKMRGPTFTTGYPQASSGSSGIYFGGTPDDSGHLYGTYSTGGGATSSDYSTGTGNGDGHTHTISASDTVSTLQPYQTVYMWRRTA